MAYPGMEDQAAENAAKAQVTHMRDSQTETARRGDVSFHVEMRANTVFEQSRNFGYDRTTAPVGEAPATRAEWETVGGRASNDILAARQLGTLGRD